MEMMPEAPEGSKPVAGTTDASTDKSTPDSNSICSTVGQNGGTGFRVKKVAEINENIGAAEISPHNGTSRKRDNEVVEEGGASTSKRFRRNSTEERLEMTIVTITASSSTVAEEVCTNGEEQAAAVCVNDDTPQVEEAESVGELEAGEHENVDEQKVEEATSESREVQASSDMEAQPASIKDEVVSGEAEEQQVADEPTPSSSYVTRSIDIKPAVKVEKADASSTSRESCKFGIRCYRRNPMHRIEEAHPGDHDYKRPSYPPPPEGTPDCQFGRSCYRRNPVHFQQYKHPPDTDFYNNYKLHRMQLRQRRQQPASGANDDSSSDLDDYDELDDPFIDDDDDSEYVPTNTENIDDEDYDECDKAEE